MTFTKLRTNINKTIPEVAKELGKSENTIKKYECSSRLPTAKTLSKMTTVFNCSIEDVMNAFNHHSSIRKFRKN